MYPLKRCHLGSILVITLYLFFLSINNVAAMGCSNIPKGKSIYSYTAKEILDFLEEIGYANFATKNELSITRSNNGRELWFFNKRSLKAIFISCNGSSYVVNLPRKPGSLNSVPPGLDIWFNENNSPIAWMDNGYIYYQNEAMKKTNDFFSSIINVRGGYFLIRNCQQGFVDIYSIEKPPQNERDSISHKGLHLIRINIVGKGFVAHFSKGNKVYLFCQEMIGGPQILYILKRNSSKLVIEKKISVPRIKKNPKGFYTYIDISPRDDEVLLKDRADPDFFSELYSFNLIIQELKKIGRAKRYNFYLQCDLIRDWEKLKGGE
jgi:hypothetical protein